MNISLDVVPLRDNQETSSFNLTLHHSECGQGRMILRRNALGTGYNLRCNCGLLLDLPDESITVITHTAIDSQPRHINLSDSVTVQLAVREISS